MDLLKMDLETVDLKNLCRTCLQPSDSLVSLFDTSFDGSCLNDVLKSLSVVIESSADNLSSQLCEGCQTCAINAYRFQQMCLDNEKRIREIIDSQSVSAIKTEAAEISQDALSLMEKIEASLDISQSDSNDVMISELKPLEEDFESETDDEISSGEESGSNESSTGDYEDNKTTQYICDSCNKSFVSNSKLKRHVLSVHQTSKSKSAESEDSSDDDDDSTKIYSCDSCPKKFKKPSLLARHVKTHDSSKRPHECTKCQKRFPSQVALIRHDIIHSELAERSKINRAEPQDFSCVICARTFKSPESLTSHLKTHRGKSEEGEYNCKLCNDAFPSYADITRHSKNHIENATHQCALCNKLLVVGDELIDHFLRHKGMKP